MATHFGETLTGVSAAPEVHRLVLVLQVILDVTHLVVRRHEPDHCDVRALFDPVTHTTTARALHRPHSPPSVFHNISITFSQIFTDLFEIFGI